MPRSYNGWPASPDPDAIGVVPFRVHGEDFPAGIKGGDVEVIFRCFLEQFHARVEPLVKVGWHKADDWGYNFRRNVNNPDLYSCHASATAIDVNATRHPNGRGQTFTAAQYEEISKILTELRSILRHLRNYDEMHFELRGTAADAKIVADMIRNGTIGSFNPPEDPDMAMTDADKAWMVQKMAEDRSISMGAIRAELDELRGLVTGGQRRRDENGNVIDPDPANVSLADVLTGLEKVQANLAALMKSQHP